MKEANINESQTSWREIMARMPEKSQLKDNELPTEEVWNWKGNQIHLDRYDNPRSRYKIIVDHSGRSAIHVDKDD